MKIAIVGAGYVGLSTGLGLASKKHLVICIDIDKEKIEKINRGILPIYEDGMEKLLKKHRGLNFKVSTDISDSKDAEIIFICVGTPTDEKGKMNLNYLKAAAKSTAGIIDKKHKTIVVKSTVLPGTTEEILLPIIEKESGKKVGKDFGLCSNPEFLREGAALKDFLGPDRIIIGEYDKKSGDILEKLYRDFNSPTIRTNIKTAEMIKMASNAFLSTKISFINEIGNICKKLEIDTYEVSRGIGYDKRIAPYFLDSGVGFGGSCFTKDIKSLIEKAREMNYDPKLLKSVTEINTLQKIIIIDLLTKKIGDLKNKKIVVLGLAFKAGTDDIREAPSIDIIRILLEKKARIHTFDPKAQDNMKKIFNEITYSKSAKEALDKADACLILTEWPEFTKLTDKDFSVMKNKTIIEGRRILDKGKVSNFEGICW